MTEGCAAAEEERDLPGVGMLLNFPGVGMPDSRGLSNILHGAEEHRTWSYARDASQVAITTTAESTELLPGYNLMADAAAIFTGVTDQTVEDLRNAARDCAERGLIVASKWSVYRHGIHLSRYRNHRDTQGV
jgi:hypothetical protein